MLPKMVCKTCLNLAAIFDEFGAHFGFLFRLRMGVPGQNFRFRSGSLLGLRFETAQVGPQGRFFEDFGWSMTCFGGIFQARSLFVGTCSENFLVCPQY